jgi:hypothetical protein
MKKSLSLIILITVNSVMLAQKGYQDTIYLKNGTSINGKIIEMAKDKSVEIQSADKIFFYFKMDQIEKIVKRPNNATDLTTNSVAKRKGYIGLSTGPSIPLSGYDYQTKTGIQLTLADFGYLFTDNFGVTAILCGAANPSAGNYTNWNYSYVNCMAGPLFSFPISEKFRWELRPMIGASFVCVYGNPVFAYGFDTGFHYNADERIAFFLNAGYFTSSGTINGLLWPYYIHYETISIGFGIAYRLK